MVPLLGSGFGSTGEPLGVEGNRSLLMLEQWKSKKDGIAYSMSYKEKKTNNSKLAMKKQTSADREVWAAFQKVEIEWDWISFKVKLYYFFNSFTCCDSHLINHRRLKLSNSNLFFFFSFHSFSFIWLHKLGDKAVPECFFSENWIVDGILQLYCCFLLLNIKPLIF